MGEGEDITWTNSKGTWGDSDSLQKQNHFHDKGKCTEVML